MTSGYLYYEGRNEDGKASWRALKTREKGAKGRAELGAKSSEADSCHKI